MQHYPDTVQSLLQLPDIVCVSNAKVIVSATGDSSIVESLDFRLQLVLIPSDELQLIYRCVAPHIVWFNPYFKGYKGDPGKIPDQWCDYLYMATDIIDDHTLDYAITNCLFFLTELKLIKL